jgi:hypothetical protein
MSFLDFKTRNVPTPPALVLIRSTGPLQREQQHGELTAAE